MTPAVGLWSRPDLRRLFPRKSWLSSPPKKCARHQPGLLDNARSLGDCSARLLTLFF